MTMALVVLGINMETAEEVGVSDVYISKDEYTSTRA